MSLTNGASACADGYRSLLRSGEHGGTRLSDAALGRGHSGECRPAALLDVGVLHPRTDLFKLGHVCRCLGALSKLVGTHRGQNCHDRGSCTFCCGFARSARQCPPTPTEADDHCCEKAGNRALQETRARLALQEGNCMRGSFRSTCFGARATDTRNGIRSKLTARTR
jgi:hypothetical protein